MKCLRCHDPLSKDDLQRGICVPCVKLIIEEWIIRFKDIGTLKVS